MLSGRRAWLILAILGLVSLWCAYRSAEVEVRRGALATAMPRALDEIAATGGLTTGGQPVVAGGLPVQIVQSAGQSWEREVVVEGVREHPALKEADSAHLLRVETIRAPNAHALQLRLSRRGWDVMLAAPVQRRAQPYLFTLCVLLGAALSLARPRRGSLWGAVAAALTLSIALYLFPMEAPVLGYPSWSNEFRAGPLWTELVHLLSQVERYLTSIVAGVIVFCGLLVYFDHRSSQDAPDSLTAPRVLLDALVYTGAGVTLIEGAMRSGWTAGLGGPWSTTGAVALIAACVVARLGAKQLGAEAE